MSEKVCSFCPSTEQVVTVHPPDGEPFNACLEHYRGVKRQKWEGEEVTLPRCENCGNVVLRGLCIQCGAHVRGDGSMVKVG